MGLLSSLLFGVRVVVDALGVTYPTRNRIRFLGAVTVADDPVFGETDVTIGGAGTSPTFGTVTATQIILGNFSMVDEPSVTTTDDSTVNLLASALAIPASGSLRVRANMEAKIVTATHTLDYTYAFTIKYVRGGTGAPALSFKNQSQEESNVNGPPFSASEVAPTPLTVTGAANNGSGVVRLTVNDTTDMANGESVTVAGVTGTGGLTAAANGIWAVTVVDSAHLDLRGSAFAGTYTSGGTVTVHGCAGPVIVGNTLQVQAVGIKPPAWIQGESVTFGAVRYAAGSGNTYIYLGSGTTLGSGSGPTGTTTGTDNGIPYEWVQAGQGVGITWDVELAEVFVQ